MSFELKKKLLSLVSLINSIFYCWCLGNDIVLGNNIGFILFDILLILISLIPFLVIRFRTNLKHLYLLIIFLALSSFFAMYIFTFIVSLIGLVISFIESDKEKGMLQRLIKRRPVFMCATVILSGLAFLSTSSIFEYLKELTYGFDMLGELCATIFLFFMIVACKKTSLIYRNKGSIKEAIVVSLPFIFYIFYIGSSLLAINLAEGYDFVSIDNIIAIAFLYILVGIFEDFLTRGLALNILLDKYGRSKKGIWLSIFLSSLFFGAIHFCNLLTGASFQGVLIQVIVATCIGLYFSAIYLRSGNVWTPALLHGFYDLAVSVPSFFMIKEVVDTASDYGEAISNYSWSNLIVGLIFIILTMILLRRSKIDNVVRMVNDREIVSYKKDGSLKFLLVGFTFGFTLTVCYMTFSSMFQIKEYANDMYDKILVSTDYYKNYNLTYINDYVDYESISDETKLLLAISNLEDSDFDYSYSIIEAEKEVKDNVIFTYISKDEIEDSLKELFNRNDNINYVDFNYSYKTSCSYDDISSKYKCITSNNQQTNNIKVYSNISKVILSGANVADVYVYYIVEDLDSGNLYADSNLNTVYMYNTSINDISDGITYDDNKSNSEFWDSIVKNNDGLVPTYKLSFDLNDLGDALYFVSSEFITDSIKANATIKEECIDEVLYQYNSNYYSFVYDKNYFSVNEINNYLTISFNDEVVMKIESVSSDQWLDKYKNSIGNDVVIGNYSYYNTGNEYLIYKDYFYIISVYNNTNVITNNKLMEVIASIEFKE